METAALHLFELGWSELYEVGAIESYDLLAINGDLQLVVEVKGTTSAGESVVLTRREVEMHSTAYPDDALIIVHSIELDGGAGPEPTTAGGTPRAPSAMVHPSGRPRGRRVPLPHAAAGSRLV